MRSLRIAGLALLTMAVLPFPVCGGAKVDTLVYQVRMKSSLGDWGTRKMTMKGSNFVFEAESAGMKMKVIKNNDGVFLLHPFRKEAGKYPKGVNRESPMAYLPGPVGDVKAFLAKNKAKAVGKEKIDKKLCDVYTYTEKESGWKCKLWVSSKDMTPVKLEMTGTKKGDVRTVTYISYKRGVPVPDSIFQLPKDIKIRPMSAKNTATNSERPDSSGSSAPTQPDGH